MKTITIHLCNYHGNDYYLNSKHKTNDMTSTYPLIVYDCRKNQCYLSL